MWSYLRVGQARNVRVEVELDAIEGSRQRHSSDQEDHQHDVRKRSCDVHDLQIQRVGLAITLKLSNKKRKKKKSFQNFSQDNEQHGQS